MPVERPQLCGPAVPSLRVGSVESRLVPPADVHDADEYRQGNFSSHASRRQLRRITRSPLSAGSSAGARQLGVSEERAEA